MRPTSACEHDNMFKICFPKDYIFFSKNFNFYDFLTIHGQPMTYHLGGMAKFGPFLADFSLKNSDLYCFWRWCGLYQPLNMIISSKFIFQRLHMNMVISGSQTREGIFGKTGGTFFLFVGGLWIAYLCKLLCFSNTRKFFSCDLDTDWLLQHPSKWKFSQKRQHVVFCMLLGWPSKCYKWSFFIR